MPEFFASSFAVAGALAAAGPILIHLLNRRRYRVVEWAAMDFLREALHRNRRVLQLRDLLLLLLRTACVLLFGLALARPHWSNATVAKDSGGPVHAVLVLDNSLSMGYERLEGTLLDEAKRKAGELIGQLPEGSRVSVLPLCGSDVAFSLDPYRNQEDAREALQKIKVVDRSGTAAQAIDLAAEACRQAADLPSKRVIFWGDQQVSNWPTGALAARMEKLPEMQVVHVAAESPENAWIADFRLQDGIADVETPTVFFATIHYEGPAPRNDVQVTLEVDGVPVASRTFDIEPDQSREVQFPYRFEVPTEPGRPTFVAASVSIQSDSVPGDRLRADNQRFLAAPVVAGLPVVFVDQFGEKEDPQRNQYGETFRLRRLLAPVAARGDFNRQLVQIQHRTIDKLDKTVLEDARLVVIAGVSSPEETVPLLREYVEQGGQLVIAAGAKFDPRAWTESAWLGGAGILPAPLKPDPIGQVPEEATTQLEPFQLALETLVHPYFQLEDASREELEDLYHRPYFFKAVAADVSPPVLKELQQAETQRITAAREFLAAADQRLKSWSEREAQGPLGDADLQQKAQDEAHRNEVAPHWLLWSEGPREYRPDESPDKQAAQSAPRVLAAFTKDRLPFLVERNIGRGQVLFVSSGLYSEWNDLTKTNAALVFDRILRSMLEQTLPQRNLESIEQVTLPVDSGDRRVEYTLTRPSGVRESLAVDALGADAYGVTIRNVTQSGNYLVAANRTGESASDTSDTKLWEIPLAVNGPERESHLQSLDAAGLRERLGAANYRWIERDEAISLEGAQISGQNLWRWLLLLVLAGLLAELLILAWPTLNRIAGLRTGRAEGGESA
jgi:hypothetical protein